MSNKKDILIYFYVVQIFMMFWIWSDKWIPVHSPILIVSTILIFWAVKYKVGAWKSGEHKFTGLLGIYWLPILTFNAFLMLVDGHASTLTSVFVIISIILSIILFLFSLSLAVGGKVFDLFDDSQSISKGNDLSTLKSDPVGWLKKNPVMAFCAYSIADELIEDKSKKENLKDGIAGAVVSHGLRKESGIIGGIATGIAASRLSESKNPNKLAAAMMGAALERKGKHSKKK